MDAHSPPATTVPAQQRYWETLLPLGLAVVAACSLFARFHAGPGFLAFYEDDFYYYLRIAQQIAAGHGSTFDGTHPTNGYHPLWMLVLVALTRICGTGLAFFSALQCILLLSVMATYFFCARAIARIAPSPAWMPRLFAVALATATLVLVSGGMEIVLAIPLLAAPVWYRLCRFAWTPPQAVALGLLCAALVLARLDAAILVTLIVLFDLLPARAVSAAQRLRCGLAFLAGCSPVAIYLALNRYWFHTFMPVSGQAKQMRFHHWPSLTCLRVNTFGPPQRYFVVYPCLLATLAGLFLLRRLRCVPAVRPIVGLLVALLQFPFFYLATLSVLSDWPIWPWYLYPLVGSALASALLAAVAFTMPDNVRALRIFTSARIPLFALLVLVWISFAAAQWRNSTRPGKPVFSTYLTALDIAHFAAAHPGLYAMGDHAGAPGYLSPQPLVQLEGLVMDKPFLQLIRAQRPLPQVLHDYGVRYYIASNPQPHDGCWAAGEPLSAGADSPHMRGLFCQLPLAEFRHSDYHTLIFDLAPQP